MCSISNMSSLPPGPRRGKSAHQLQNEGGIPPSGARRQWQQFNNQTNSIIHQFANSIIPMKLNIKAFAITCAIFMGLGLFGICYLVEIPGHKPELNRHSPTIGCNLLLGIVNPAAALQNDPFHPLWLS